MRNRIFTTCLLSLCIAASGLLKAENDKPFVIPELRQWQGADGMAAITSKSKVVYVNDELAGVAEAMAEDYGLLFGKKLKTQAASKATKGSIIMTLTDDKELGDEGYTIEINDAVAITANTTTGIYWATRTLLQILEQYEGTNLPKGTIRDWPDYALRGFMIDCGRKYIPLDYLKAYTKIMAYYKMNTLQVHLNDNGFKQYFGNDWDKTYAAFRIESELFPELTAKDGYYGKEEFRQFQKDAAKIGVNIIPEIDVPAHSLAFTHFRKELGTEKYGMDHLDLYNPNVITFLDSLFTEYLEGEDPVFVGKQVHIGTDEYSNAEKETVEKFRAFTDHYIRLVESFDKQACVWGALTHAKGDTPVKADNVIMHCWYNGYADPTEMKKQGYKLVSIPDGSVYIVPAAGYYYDYLNLSYLYHTWNPSVIGNQKFEAGDPAILGGMYAVWNDVAGNGISVDDIHHRCYPGLQAISTATWSPTYRAVPFEEFNHKRTLLSEAPGVNELNRFPGQPGSVVYTIDKVKAGKRYPHAAAGYDYSVSFHIDGVKEERGTLLFSNNDTEFYLSSPIDGRMAFVRDGYLNTFDFYVEQGKSADITIECTNTATRLIVNGELKDELKRAKRWASEKTSYDYVPTLCFPLQQAGNFKSTITRLEVKNIMK
ncbi:MAG: family 20 glycosylhydrolase [Bacteroidaceae bacterium]|nr:family 20 glycosylhydrolase [Bacteroidaceae bacterium]